MKRSIYSGLVATSVALSLLTSNAAHAASGPVVANQASSTAVVLSDATTVTAVGAANTQDYVVPSGCVPADINGASVSLNCRIAGQRMRPQILDLRSGQLTAVLVPPALAEADIAVVRSGTRWLESSSLSSPDGIHTDASRQLIEWRTGRMISLEPTDRFGAARWLSLTGPDPSSRLCAPARRVQISPFRPRFGVTIAVGSYVLSRGTDGDSLQHCGSKRAMRFATSARAQLGQRHVAFLRGRTIVLRNLTTGSERRYAWPSSDRPILAISRKTLYITSPSSDGSTSITTKGL